MSNGSVGQKIEDALNHRITDLGIRLLVLVGIPILGYTAKTFLDEIAEVKKVQTQILLTLEKQNGVDNMQDFRLRNLEKNIEQHQKHTQSGPHG